MTFAGAEAGILYEDSSAVYEVAERAVEFDLKPNFNVADQDSAWYAELCRLVSRVRASLEPGTPFEGIADEHRFAVQDLLLQVLSTIPGVLEDRDVSPDTMPGFTSALRLYFSADPASAIAEFHRRVAVMSAAINETPRR
jgi:hypothetical protein